MGTDKWYEEINLFDIPDVVNGVFLGNSSAVLRKYIDGSFFIRADLFVTGGVFSAQSTIFTLTDNNLLESNPIFMGSSGSIDHQIGGTHTAMTCYFGENDNTIKNGQALTDLAQIRLTIWGGTKVKRPVGFIRQAGSSSPFITT